MLPYFQERAAEADLVGSFPIFVVAWRAPDDFKVKLVVTGHADGSIISRLILGDPSGRRTVDKAHHYPPGDDPDDVWQAVTTIIAFIDAADLWEDVARVTDYLDSVALDAEREAARADAIAAGLMTERKRDACESGVGHGRLAGSVRCRRLATRPDVCPEVHAWRHRHAPGHRRQVACSLEGHEMGYAIRPWVTGTSTGLGGKRRSPPATGDVARPGPRDSQ